MSKVPAILVGLVGLVSFSGSNLSDLTCSPNADIEEVPDELSVVEGGW